MDTWYELGIKSFLDHVVGLNDQKSFRIQESQKSRKEPQNRKRPKMKKWEKLNPWLSVKIGFPTDKSSLTGSFVDRMNDVIPLS